MLHLLMTLHLTERNTLVIKCVCSAPATAGAELNSASPFYHTPDCTLKPSPPHSRPVHSPSTLSLTSFILLFYPPLSLTLWHTRTHTRAHTHTHTHTHSIPAWHGGQYNPPPLVLVRATVSTYHRTQAGCPGDPPWVRETGQRSYE